MSSFLSSLSSYFPYFASSQQLISSALGDPNATETPPTAYHALDKSISLKEHLEDFHSRVNSKIKNQVQFAVTHLNRPYVMAGIEIQKLIQSATNLSNLKKGWGDMDESNIDFIGNLSLLVKEIEKKDDANLERIHEIIQYEKNHLVGDKKETLLTNVTPPFIALDERTSFVKISIFGRFHFHSILPPTLHIGRYKAILQNSTSVQLDFEIPTDALVPHVKTDGFRYVTADFSAPWQTQSFLGKVSKQLTKFNLYLEVLPPVPGKIIVVYEDQQAIVIKDLFWGKQRKVGPLNDKKITQITLEAFNGQSFSFLPETQISHPFLKLYALGGKIILHADITTPHDVKLNNISIQSHSSNNLENCPEAITFLHQFQAKYMFDRYALEENHQALIKNEKEEQSMLAPSNYLNAQKIGIIKQKYDAHIETLRTISQIISQLKDFQTNVEKSIYQDAAPQRDKDEKSPE